jgi:hypothetical protein
MVELKPCPFCAADGEWMMDLFDTFDAGHIAYVRCGRCDSAGPSKYSEVSAQDAANEARVMWNRRCRRQSSCPPLSCR